MVVPGVADIAALRQHGVVLALTDLQKRYELQKFLLNVTYTNPFGEIKSFSKQGEIIL